MLARIAALVEYMTRAEDPNPGLDRAGDAAAKSGTGRTEQLGPLRGYHNPARRTNLKLLRRSGYLP
jgi:hypothetical protein